MKRFEEYNKRILEIKDLLSDLYLRADSLTPKEMEQLEYIVKEVNKRDSQVLEEMIQEEKQEQKEASTNVVLAYVDGSFDKETKLFGSGVVFVKDDEPIEEISFSGLDKHNQWNVCGECEASIEAIEIAIDRGYKKIVIHHDYQGISSWAERNWKAKNVYTQSYVARFDKLKEKIEIEFVKVKGHSDNKWNDLADNLAKRSLGKR